MDLSQPPLFGGLCQVCPSVGQRHKAGLAWMLCLLIYFATVLLLITSYTNLLRSPLAPVKLSAFVPLAAPRSQAHSKPSHKANVPYRPPLPSSFIPFPLNAMSESPAPASSTSSSGVLLSFDMSSPQVRPPPAARSSGSRPWRLPASAVASERGKSANILGPSSSSSGVDASALRYALAAQSFLDGVRLVEQGQNPSSKKEDRFGGGGPRRPCCRPRRTPGLLRMSRPSGKR